LGRCIRTPAKGPDESELETERAVVVLRTQGLSSGLVAGIGGGDASRQNATEQKMSDVIFEVGCDGCDFKATLGGVGLPRYESAWCHGCRSMVDAERLPTAAELGKIRAKLKESVGRRDLVTDHVYTEEDAERLAAPRERWFAARRSSARCLVCGSTEIVPHDPLEDEPFVHPGCGGRIAWRGPLTFVLTGTGVRIDTEGRRLSG
jgi:hypothetical protein